MAEPTSPLAAFLQGRAGQFAAPMLDTPGYRPGPRESQNVIDRRGPSSMTPFGQNLMSLLQGLTSSMVRSAPEPSPQIIALPQELPPYTKPPKIQARLGEP